MGDFSKKNYLLNESFLLINKAYVYNIYELIIKYIPLLYT